jgi:phage terminase small subunit
MHQKRHEVTVDRIIKEFAKIGFSNAGDYFTWGPAGVTVKSSDELTEEQRSAVEEVSQTVTKDGGTIKVKLHSKQVALERLGKHLGMFTDKTEISGPNGGPIETKETSELELARKVAFALGRAVGRGETHKDQKADGVST